MKLLLTLAFCFFASSVAVDAAEKEEVKSECTEFLKFSFDDRDWEQSFDESNEEGSIIEFTLKGENVDNWSELVTVQRFPPIHASPEEYYHIFIKGLQKMAASSKVQSKIIDQDNDSMFFEWWIDDKGPADQHEWFKLIETPNSVLVLRYTTKKMDSVEKARTTWEKILKGATSSSEGCEETDSSPSKSADLSPK